MTVLLKPKIAHIILAAGSSSRLGSPKQLLPWGNTTLIGHEINKSIQLNGVTTYLVLGAYYKLITKKIKYPPITIINNVDWKSGIGSSISFGVKYIIDTPVDYDGILITLVDQPLIDQIHLNDLIMLFSKNPNMIVGTKMKNNIGVPAIFPKSFMLELASLTIDYGAKFIIKNNIDNVLSIQGVGKVDDIDTVEEYNTIVNRVR